MPKKKTKKKKNKIKLSHEGLGVIYISIAIIALPPLGAVGHYMSDFGTWLFGVYGSMFYLSIFVLGSFLIYKGEYPNMFSRRLSGFYLLMVGLLLISHGRYVRDNTLIGNNVIPDTFKELIYAMKANDITNVGGGMIGAILSYLFLITIDDVGLKIFSVFFIAFGVSFLFNKNLIEMIRSIFLLLNKQRVQIKKKAKKPKVKKPKKVVIKEEVKKAEEEFEGTKKIVISNFEELKDLNKSTDTVESVGEVEATKEKIVNSSNDPMQYSHYRLPPLSLLEGVSDTKKATSTNLFVEQNASLLEETLNEFGVIAKVVAINVGPTVTQYELDLKRGTKVSRIVSLSKEIALSLAAQDVRIQAPIPKKNTIGVEIPNDSQSIVTLKEIISQKDHSNKNPLKVGLGRDILGKPIWVEINSMPHLLVAGATGSGKSVCINSIIISILMQAKPNEVKLILVDPKKVELNGYNGIPHLMAPVVTDPKKASIALKKVCTEMDRRYELFSNAGTRNIAGYNKYLELNDEEEKKIPYIVVIVDELADLMMVAKGDVEEAITRITQLARAAGIHLVIATQRPSTDVITGLIKANVPSRIAFGVSRSIDSRVILDTQGAEKLLGKGDMLFLGMGESSPIRIQGTYLSDDEVDRVVNHCIKQQVANYDASMSNLEESTTKQADIYEDHEDELYDDVTKFVIENNKASASLLQRRFRVGYNRAARLIDSLEANGVIGPSNGSKPREVLIKLEVEQEG